MILYEMVIDYAANTNETLNLLTYKQNVRHSSASLVTIMTIKRPSQIPLKQSIDAGQRLISASGQSRASCYYKCTGENQYLEQVIQKLQPTGTRDGASNIWGSNKRKCHVVLCVRHCGTHSSCQGKHLAISLDFCSNL